MHGFSLGILRFSQVLYMGTQSVSDFVKTEQGKNSFHVITRNQAIS